MLARDIMSTSLVTVREDLTVPDAARLMVERQVSGLPVVDAEGALIGIVTERDVLLRHETIRCVGDVMTRGVVTAEETADYMDLVEILLQHGIKRVPIVRDNRLIGIVSRTDLLRGLIEEEAQAAQAAGSDGSS